MAAAHKVVLKGPSVVKEIILGITLGVGAGFFWKIKQWEGQRKTRTLYDLLDKDEATLTVLDE